MPTNPSPMLADGRMARITSGFGMRGERFHFGVDLGYLRKDGEPLGYPTTSPNGKWIIPDDLPALAYLPGKVLKSYWGPTGDVVVLDHGSGLWTVYVHMRNRLVKKGDVVREGAPLGTISYSPLNKRLDLNHIHFEVHKNGKAVDPKPYLKDAKHVRAPSKALAFLVAAALIGAGIYWYRRQR